MDVQTEKKVTIDQVAKLCGVSKTTISRYLNGKFENISAEKRETIKKVIEELGYRPNRSAQRLKASRSMLIGCTIGDVGSPFSALLLRGITQVCEAAGYQVLFADSGEDSGRERHAIEGFMANRVDGLIVNSPGGNEELLMSIQAQGTPVVLADRGFLRKGMLDTVASTDRESAVDAVGYLVSCGYSRIAFFTENMYRVVPRLLRCEGYVDAIKKYFGAEAEPLVCEFDRGEAETCGKYLRSFRERFPGERIAILSVNGVTAQHIIHAMGAEGFEMGADFGLCTFDDWTWHQLVQPGITSISKSTQRIGEEAARMLLRRISGECPYDAPANYIEVPTKLVVRGSTSE